MLFDSARYIIGQANIKFSLMVLDNVNAISHRSWKKIWLRGRDLNPRPSGYEPDELPGCSTPHFENNFDIDIVQIEKAFVRWKREVK